MSGFGEAWANLLRWSREVLPIGIVVLLTTSVCLFILYGPPHAAESGHPEAWQLVFNLAAFIFFLGVMLAFIAVAHHDLDNDNAFVTGMVATGALIPTTVTEVSTLAAYVIPQACYVPHSWIGSQV